MYRRHPYERPSLTTFQENDISQLQTEILDMWQKLKTPEPPPAQSLVNYDEVDVKLAKLLESRILEVPKQRQYTAEEKRIKDNILSQYSQMTDDEEEGEEDGAENGGLEKNRNASTVAQAEKEKREQARLESQRKKDKDKEDRLVFLSEVAE